MIAVERCEGRELHPSIGELFSAIFTEAAGVRSDHGYLQVSSNPTPRNTAEIAKAHLKELELEYTLERMPHGFPTGVVVAEPE